MYIEPGKNNTVSKYLFKEQGVHGTKWFMVESHFKITMMIS
jgi:hypothetical protein